jgi:hypothetical protein
LCSFLFSDGHKLIRKLVKKFASFILNLVKIVTNFTLIVSMAGQSLEDDDLIEIGEKKIRVIQSWKYLINGP